jgi:hypothetical protein
MLLFVLFSIPVLFFLTDCSLLSSSFLLRIESHFTGFYWCKLFRCFWLFSR